MLTELLTLFSIYFAVGKNSQYHLCQTWITSGTCWSAVTCNDIYQSSLGKRKRHKQLQLGFSIAFFLGPGNRFSSHKSCPFFSLRISSALLVNNRTEGITKGIYNEDTQNT